MVKTLLEMPNLSGKHARWWKKVYRMGIGKVKVVYQPGRETRMLMLHP